MWPRHLLRWRGHRLQRMPGRLRVHRHCQRCPGFVLARHLLAGRSIQLHPLPARCSLLVASGVGHRAV